MFEWIERIQYYTDWDYMINLQNFVDGGSWDDSFIDAVSSIFTQGCHSSYCSSTMDVTKLDTRRENFVKLLELFSETPPQMSPSGQTQQWEFDPAIPTTQQWNGNSPIDLTPTWALDYYGNPPAQLIPTLEGYNPSTQTWNANPPAQLASSWEEYTPSITTSQQGNGNSYPTTQQGNVPSLPSTQQWSGNSPTQIASRPEGNDAATPSSQDTLIPIEDSSALLPSFAAFWMTTLLVFGFLNIF